MFISTFLSATFIDAGDDSTDEPVKVIRTDIKTKGFQVLDKSFSGYTKYPQQCLCQVTGKKAQRHPRWELK